MDWFSGRSAFYILAGEFILLWLLEWRFCYYRFERPKFLHGIKNLVFTAINLTLRYPVSFFSIAILQKHDWHSNFINGLPIAEPWQLLLTILIIDLWMYFWHRINHEVSFLWRFHNVHHSDPAMDVTSSSRFHFMELIFSELIRIPIFLILGFKLQHIAFYNAIMMLNVLFHHSNLNIGEPLDKIYRLLFASPFLHKIHHSSQMEETNSNYGTLFSFWDRMFGSFRMTDTEKITIGLDGGLSLPENQTLIKLFLAPFRQIP